MLNQILHLARELSIPEEMTAQLPAIWAGLDMEQLSPHIHAMTVQEQEPTAYESLTKIFADTDPDGLKMLACQLRAALQTRENYAQKGISDTIFIDTMKCFARYSRESFAMRGRYTFDRGWWVWRQLSIRLVRLGVLEFEYRADLDAISVHIPSDAVMTVDGLHESYDMAKEFYIQQNITYKEIYCRTWLLSPVLKEILPPESRILNFQRDYKITELFPDSTSFMRWVYHKEYGQAIEDVAGLPENTTLQREIKKLLLAGKTVGDAYGRLIY